jgi:hypothetical protein
MTEVICGIMSLMSVMFIILAIIIEKNNKK